MMNDDFLNDARVNWRAQDEQLEQLTRRLRRQRVWSKLMVAGELASAAIAVAAGIWLLTSNIEGYVVLGRIAGGVLLLAVPALTAASLVARRAQPKWEDETPEGVLRYALRRLDVVVSLLRLARWHAYVLAGFVVALWAAAIAGLIAKDAVLAGFSVFYLATAGIAFAWARWRHARAARERARCEALLAEFRRELA